MKPTDLAAGVTIGRKFRLRTILGRGSYGDVWLADVVDGDSLPRQVALKVYSDPERATRKLLEEFDKAKEFHHERLVRVYGAARLDGLVVMWMEYVRGETLLERLGNSDAPRPVSLWEVLIWLKQIAEGLAYLHTMDPVWVHGDLKLDNVLLDGEAGARLVDFGQSRTIGDQFVETNGVGAWPYLAPEVLGRSSDPRGRRYVASDIYAAGVMAYRALTGRFPRRTLQEAVNLTPFPRTIELNSSVPPALDELVSRCLEKRPEDRFSSGAALLAAIDKLERKIAEPEKAPLAIPLPVETMQPTPAGQIAAFARALLDRGEIEETLAQLERAMQRMSTAPRVLIVYAEACKRGGRFEAAHTVYRRVLRWMDDNDASDDERRDGVEGLAEMSIRLKRYEDAVARYAWLAERWPEKKWYVYSHGVALGLAAQYRKSIEVLRPFSDQYSPSANVSAKLGFAYMQLGDTEQASQYFNEALMLDQYEPTALFHLARIRAIQGKDDRSVSYLRRLEQVQGAEDQARELARLLGQPPAAGRGAVG